MILTLFMYILFLTFLYWLFNIYQTNLTNNTYDIFAPQSFFLIYAMLEIPYLWLVISNPKNIPYDVFRSLQDFESLYTLHIFNSMIYILIVLIFLKVFNPKPKLSVLLFKLNLTKKMYLKLHIILLIITILSYYIFLNTIGGLTYLLLNLDSKVSLIQGTGYIQAVYTVASTLSVGVLIVYFSHDYTKLSFKQKVYFALIIILIFSMFATTGGRKNSILFLAFVFVIWHYKVSKIKYVTTTNTILFILILFFFAFMPILRTYGAAEYFLNNPNEAFLATLENLGLLFKRFSDIDRSLFIYQYFNIDNLWYGKSFIDILYAPIPRSVFPDKPPIDEGVYIYNLLHGNNVIPSTPLRRMYAVGLPTTTITGMYINFWYFGIIIGAILMAYIMKYSYNLSIKTNYSPQSVMLYTSVIFGNFAITNLRIVGFLTLVLFILLIMKISTILTRFKL